MAEKPTGKPLALSILSKHGDRMKVRRLKDAYFQATGRGSPGEPIASAMMLSIIEELVAENHVEASYLPETIPGKTPVMDEVWVRK